MTDKITKKNETRWTPNSDKRDKHTVNDTNWRQSKRKTTRLNTFLRRKTISERKIAGKCFYRIKTNLSRNYLVSEYFMLRRWFCSLFFFAFVAIGVRGFHLPIMTMLHRIRERASIKRYLSHMKFNLKTWVLYDISRNVIMLSETA